MKVLYSHNNLKNEKKRLIKKVVQRVKSFKKYFERGILLEGNKEQSKNK
jgi:hypothetical protein